MDYDLNVYIRLLIIFLVGGSLIIGFVIAYALHGMILPWLYEQMRPKRYRAKLGAGERIEGVFQIDFWCTTGVWLAGWINRILIPSLLFVILFNILGGEGFAAVLFYYFFMIAALAQAVANVFVFPFMFLKKEWDRIRIRFVATTLSVTAYELDFNWAALGTGDAPDPYVSQSDMMTLKREKRWAANPKRLNHRFRTGFLAEEFVIPLRASLGEGTWRFGIPRFWGDGIRSMLLLTYVQQATDQYNFVRRGTTLIEIINSSAPRASLLLLKAQRTQAAMVDAEIGKPGVEYDEASIKETKEEIERRTAEKRWLPGDYDPFTEPVGSQYWDIQRGIELVPYTSNGSDAGFEPVYVGH